MENLYTTRTTSEHGTRWLDGPELNLIWSGFTTHADAEGLWYMNNL